MSLDRHGENENQLLNSVSQNAEMQDQNRRRRAETLLPLILLGPPITIAELRKRLPLVNDAVRVK